MRVLAGEAPHAHRREHVEVGRERAHATPRSAPGRCPCRCSRARPRRRRTRGPRRRGAWRSPGATAPTRAGTCPRRARWPGSRARGSRRRTRRARRRRCASTAPAASARARIVVPRVVGRLADVDRERDHLGAPLLLDPLHRHRRVETARVREHHSLGHRRSPLFVAIYRARRARPSSAATARAAGALRAHHDDRVVAGDGAEHVGEPGPVERGADDVRRTRRRAQHDEVRRCAPPPPRTRPSPGGGGRRARRAPWRARGSRRPSRRRGCAPSPRRAPRGRGSPWPAWR